MERFEQLYRDWKKEAKKLVNDLDVLPIEALVQVFDHVDIENEKMDDVRKAVSLLVLEETTQLPPNNQPTPDAVSLFMGYLATKLLKDGATILNLGSGTGTLTHAVLSQLKEATAQAVEVDELLLRLSYSISNLLGEPVSYFHQDALAPLFVEPSDLSLADLPIGYYPNDEVAAEYDMKRNEGHAYSHFLMMEQAIRHTKPGGHGLFVIPNNLFEQDDEGKLKQWMDREAVVKGVIQLPTTMFKDERYAKSLLLLQKVGEGVTRPKQALFVELPSFTDVRAVANVVKQIDDWFKTTQK
ncbi:class I SAM-dependent methyltransferase [Exiguobacterium sp. B2(2022)]|uniref:class I SAM-dependent methyltransferase n=1 Tax=Exiguobacterium sp. B2(2022) TaxID=2992755 RepID=UPI00237BE840|nr:class I SAM-dependent methyltransferase [Exiguobacterium sp. B2(2022)]MDE0562275.1 class I SAM-dependent methyltransferase [Exiguobacterium sp. B2(2022)]